MLPPAVHVTSEQARRLLLHAHGISNRFESVGAALAHHGYVQMDPINVCGRMHDLILRNRVPGYQEGGLLRHLHGTQGGVDRAGFEHYLPGRGVLAGFPTDAWAFLSATIHRRRERPVFHGRPLSRSERTLAERILGEIAGRGPLTSDDIEHEGRTITAWGTDGRLAKAMLEHLFIHGRLLITTRRGFRRVYDLPERVLPQAVLAAEPATEAASERWAVHLSLRQRRLVRLRAGDVTKVEDIVQPVRIDGQGPFYCLSEDVPSLDLAADDGGVDGRPRLLAPLDPLICDRRATKLVWSFDYTWEVYTPAAKRMRGYYALPVLSRGELVGHVDPRADREEGTLTVMSRRVKRGHAVAEAVRELARFLGLRTSPAGCRGISR